MSGGRSRSPRRRAGFTLIEAALATTIIGVGILALLNAMGAGTRVNQQGRHLTQAVFLAQQVREWTLWLDFVDPDTPNNAPGHDGSSPLLFVDDLDDLNGITFGLGSDLPRDANGGKLNGMSGWTQRIELEWRDPNCLTANVGAPTRASEGSGVICVTVYIGYQGQDVHQSSWLVVRRS